MNKQKSLDTLDNFMIGNGILTLICIVGGMLGLYKGIVSEGLESYVYYIVAMLFGLIMLVVVQTERIIQLLKQGKKL